MGGVSMGTGVSATDASVPGVPVPAGSRQLLGKVLAVNGNSANTDNPIVLNIPAGATYRVYQVEARNASISLTLATAALFTAAAGGGTAIVTAGALAALTAAGKVLDMTLALTDTQTAATLYWRTATAQGAAATYDVYIWGQVYP